MRTGARARTRKITGLELDRQGHQHRPEPHRAHAALQPGDATPACCDDIRALFASTQDAKRARLRPGRFWFNVSGGRCEACNGDGHDEDRDALPARRLRPVRGLRGQALQPRDAARCTYQGQEHRRGAGHDASEDALAFFEHIRRHHATSCRRSFDVGLGYIQPGSARPQRSPAARRSASSLQAELSKRRQPARRSIFSTSRRPACTWQDVAPADRRVCSAWLTRATRCSSSSTTSTSSRCADHIVDLRPGGRRAGRHRWWPQGTPEEVAQVEGSFTGAFVKKMLGDHAG